MPKGPKRARLTVRLPDPAAEPAERRTSPRDSLGTSPPQLNVGQLGSDGGGRGVRDSEQAGPDRGDFLSGAYQQRGGASGFQAKSDGGDYDGLRMRGTLHGSRSPIAQLQNIGRTTMAAPLEDDILPTLEQLGRLAAAHLGTNAGSVFDALGIRGAVEKAQARRRKTGSQVPQG